MTENISVVECFSKYIYDNHELQEYENLTYAMYHSDDTPLIYKSYFEKILFELGEKKK